MAGVFGLIYGSFSGVVIGRAPLTVRALIPGSRCDSCATPIKWYQNIPVISWLVLRGRCAACGSSILVWSPVLELASGLMFALVALWGLRIDSTGLVTADSLLQTVTYLGMVTNGLCIAIIDLNRRQIPNLLVVTGLVWGVLGFGADALFFGHTQKLIVALLAMAVFFAFLLLIKLAVPRGMGAGDVKLAAVLGLYLGWQGWGALAVGVFASFAFGAVFGLVYLAVKGGGRKTTVPFGPWLIIGTWFGILLGERIWADYLAIIR
ncbi:MAG: hypothetical protein RL508_1109 [Actinomycetota bacterium]|jgi:leader peptidase (prepilin peptidase)/N-methyltransferase